MVDLDTPPPATDAVLSIVKLRERHGDLSREYGGFTDKPSREFLDKVAAFQAAASAAGTAISSIDERLEIQSRINFWQSARINAGQRPATVLLAPFDREAAKRAAGGKAPYKGLAPFQIDDAKNFSGRYEIVGLLVKKVLTHRLLALVGQSGSGKSSVVRAGLIPQLADGAYDGVGDGDLTDSKTWDYPTPIVPGADPLGALEAVYCRDGKITMAADLPAALDRVGKPVLLSIDQFEEVFTLSEEGPRRDLFFDALLAAASSGTHRHIVVLTMRSDYQNRVKEAYPTFFDEFEKGKLVIETMQASDLRKAIEEPAARLGVGFEAGLVDKLQTSVLGEPAGLPLLSFTLLKLWEARTGTMMSLADYEKLGNDPRVILTRSADEVLNGLPLAEDKSVVKEIFTRLVKINKTLDATSNRIKRAALEDALGRSDSVDRVLGILVANNLIRMSPAGAITPTTDIEVSHEALIRNWETLTKWVREGLAAETSRRVFAVLAETWAKRETIKDKKGDLLAGLALQEAEKFEDKNKIEIDFIAASKAEQRKREAKRRWVTIAMGILLLIAVVFLVSVLADSIAKEDEKHAELSHALIEDGEIALARKVIFQILSGSTDPNPEIAAALQAAELNDTASELLTSPGGKVLAVSFADDGRALVSLWGDGVVRIFVRNSAAAGQRASWSKKPIELRLTAGISAVAMSPVPIDPDGHVFRAATVSKIAGNKSQLSLWEVDLEHPSQPANLLENAIVPVDATVSAITYDSEGKAIFATQSDSLDSVESHVIVYEGDTLEYVRFMPDSDGKYVQRLISPTATVISPEDKWLVVGTKKGQISSFDFNSGSIASDFKASKKAIANIAFTRMGDRYAVASEDGVVQVFLTANDEKQFQFNGHSKSVTGVAFSPDGSLMVTGSADGSARLWGLGLRSGQQLRVLTDNPKNSISAVAFNSDGDSIAIATSTGVKIVNLGNARKANPQLLWPDSEGLPQLVGASPDGSVIVVSGYGDGGQQRLAVWDVATRKPPRFIDIKDEHELWHVVASNSGRIAVVFNNEINETKLNIFGVEAGRAPTTSVSIEFSRTTPALSPDGKIFVNFTDTGLEIVREGDKTPTQVGYAPQQAEPGLAKVILAEDPSVLTAFSTNAPLRMAVVIGNTPATVIYDLAPGKTFGTAIGSFESPEPVKSLEFAPDGATIFAGTETGNGAILTVGGAGKKPLVTLNGGHRNSIDYASFSPDGERLATGSLDTTARVWNVRDGTLISTMQGHQASVRGVFLSPDGKRVLTSSEDGSAKLWDVATGRILTTLKGSASSGGIVGWFNADGSEARTVSEDATLRRWKIATGKFDEDTLKAQICADGGKISQSQAARIELELELEQMCKAYNAAAKLASATGGPVQLNTPERKPKPPSP